MVRELRRLLFTPHPLLPDGSPLAHVATQEAQQSLQQLMHALGNVEGVFAGGLEDVAAALPGMDAADACAGCRSSSSSSGQQVSATPVRTGLDCVAHPGCRAACFLAALLLGSCRL